VNEDDEFFQKKIKGYDKKYEAFYDRLILKVEDTLESQGWVDLYDIMDNYTRGFLSSLVSKFPLNIKEKLADSALMLRVMEYEVTKYLFTHNFNKDELKRVLHYKDYDYDLWFADGRNIDA